MDQNSNIKIIPALSGWLLLLCCVVGCASSTNKAMSGQLIPCDPTYGFRPTCWHHWPGYCGTGSGPRWPEPRVERLPEEEVIPTPPAEANDNGQQSSNHQPQAPRIPIESLSSKDRLDLVYAGLSAKNVHGAEGRLTTE